MARRHRFGLSVRSRLTLAVAALSAAAFAATAVIAPGAIRNALQDDLLEAEADSARFFAQLSSGQFDDADFLRDEDGNIVDVDAGGLIVIDDALAPGLPPLDDVPGNSADDPHIGDLDVVAPAQIIEPRVDLLRELDVFDSIIDTAGGPFTVDVAGGVAAVVDTDGSFEIVEQDADQLGVPVFTQTEVDEYLFEDLGLFESQSGAFLDTNPQGRIATDVIDVDGVDYLVTADATAVDRSADRVRNGLWLAVPFLTAIVAALAWSLASRSLRPVRSITDQAATISGGSLDARVPVPASNDEIATLAVTVNEMLDRLEADDRMRRRFISDASHELRSPVAVMRNEAEVALHHPDAADTTELAASVAAESERMATIIDDLLALARHDEGVPAPTTAVDLEDIVLAETRRSRRVPVDTSAVSAGRVSGRVDEMARLVAHLLDNAARHASEHVAVSLRTSNNAVTLIIDDDGPGVPPDRREQVFERFARLDEARTRDSGGAGLGLAVVAGIAARSGGTVDVGDATLGGARFTVTFPC